MESLPWPPSLAGKVGYVHTSLHEPIVPKQAVMHCAATHSQLYVLPCAN